MKDNGKAGVSDKETPTKKTDVSINDASKPGGSMVGEAANFHKPGKLSPVCQTICLLVWLSVHSFAVPPCTCLPVV